VIIFNQKIEVLTASNIPDELIIDGTPVTIDPWTPSTEYFPDDIKRFGSWYYRCATHIEATEDREDPSKDKSTWSIHSPSNTYAMIDDRSNTATETSGTSIVVEFDNVDRYDAIAFGQLKASNVKVEIFDSVSTLLYTREVAINEIGTDAEANWYSYYYAPLADETSRYDLYMSLPQTGVKIKVTISESTFGGTACSFMVAGNGLYCGEAKSEVSFRFEDNSIKEKDPFGITNLVQRYAQDISDVDTTIETNYFLALKRKMKKMYGIPLAVVIDEREDTKYENLLSLSYLDDFGEILRDANKRSRCNFSFSELV
jgi:hypothetical protein